MGNSMLRPLKGKAEYMMESLGDKLGTDFNKNKKAVDCLKLPLSKKVRNRVCGYIVRTIKRKNKKD